MKIYTILRNLTEMEIVDERKIYRKRNEKQHKITKRIKIKQHLVAMNLVSQLELCDSSNSAVSRQLQSATTFVSYIAFYPGLSTQFIPFFFFENAMRIENRFIILCCSLQILNFIYFSFISYIIFKESSVIFPIDCLSSKSVNCTHNHLNPFIEIKNASKVNDYLISNQRFPHFKSRDVMEMSQRQFNVKSKCSTIHNMIIMHYAVIFALIFNVKFHIANRCQSIRRSRGKHPSWRCYEQFTWWLNFTNFSQHPIHPK